MMIFQLSLFATLGVVILLSSQCASQATLMQKSTEVKLDGSDSMELVCSVTGSVSGSRVWTGGPGFQPLITNGISTDSSKYTETVQTVEFSLHVHNVIVDDVCGVDFMCTNGFFDSPQVTIVLNSSIFRYVPIPSDIQVLNKVYDDMKMTILVNLTTVFPEPTCNAELGTIDITSKLQSNSYNNGNCGLKSTELRINNETYHCPAGQLVITCMVGSQSITAYRGSLPCQSEAKESWIQVICTSVFNNFWKVVVWLLKRLWNVLCCLSCKKCCRPFTVIVALAWCYYLSRRYVLNGRVVYGIQFAVVAATSQLVTIISAVIVLTIYEEQNESSVTPIMLSQIPLSALLSVGIYFLLKAYCCQREWTYTEFFKDRLIDCFLSTYGIKFATINKDKIWFKVWAKDDVLLTLFGNNKIPFLYIIMGYGNRNRKFKSQSSRPVVACDNVLGTDNKYRIFSLTCEKHCVTIVRVLNGEEEIVLKWSLDHSPLNIGDIRISNYMQDLAKEKESKETAEIDETAETTVTEANAATTAITISQSGTQGEWIFFIRKGDCLHKDDDDSRCSKNLTLFFVLLLPVAWIVVPILFIIKLIMHCAKDNRNSKDANGKCEEKSQPNDAMIAADDEWMHKDVGKNIPDLPSVDLNKKADAVPDDTKQTKKKAKSKKNKQGSNRNEIQQPQEDTGNNTVQTVTDQ